MGPRLILLRTIPVLRQCCFAEKRHLMLWGCRFFKNRDQCTLTTGKNDRLSQANLSAFVDCCFNCSDHIFTILNRWDGFNPLQTMPYLLAARLFSGNTKQMSLATDE